MPDLKPYRIGLQLVSKNEGCEDESGMLQLEILARDATAAARLGVHTALRLSGETLQGKLEVSLAPAQHKAEQALSLLLALEKLEHNEATE